MPLAPKPERRKIVVLGDTEVGKSTLTSRYLRPEDTPNDQYVATIGIDFSAKEVKLPGPGGDPIRVRLQIWDTAGAERFRTLSSHYVQDAAAVIVVYDITRKDTFDSVRQWVEMVTDKCIESDASPPLLFLVGNKIDLQNGMVSTREGKDLAAELGATFFMTSAKEDCNVAKLFEDVARMLAGMPSPMLLGAPSDDILGKPDGREEHSPKRCRCWPF